MFGWILLETDEDGNKTRIFKKSNKAFRGWVKIAPQQPGDPLPFGWLCRIGLKLLMSGAKKKVLAAAAIALEFDSYGRPGEITVLHGKCLVSPSPKAGPAYAKRWAMVIAPSTDQKRSKT